MQQDITSQISQLHQLGWTDQQIKRIHKDVDTLGDKWIVWNRRAEAAVDQALAQAKRDAKLAGCAHWTKRDGEWMVRGRGLKAGAQAQVARRDGTTKTVTVGKIVADHDGEQIATITRDPARPRYTTVDRYDGARIDHYATGATMRHDATGTTILYDED